MKKTLLLTAITLLTLNAHAQQISVSEACNRAKSFMKTRSNARHSVFGTQTSESDVQLAYTSTRDTDKKVCFYVFNQSADGGFVIVGGDESASEILAYSDQGSFDYDSAPENFKWWLSQYKEQISAAMDEESTSTSATRRSVMKAATNTKKSITPMLTTEWDQIDPYNSAIPSLGAAYTGNSALATGCVATAMSQIMKYYNYPSSGYGSTSYQMDWGRLGTVTYSADFANTQYDWTHMTDTYDESSSITEKKAVATLMYHSAVSVGTVFGQISSGGSAASASDAMKALCTNFRYSQAIRYETRQFFSDESWENMIYNQLKSGRPVLYGGTTKMNIGHAFVCDGYNASDDTYHMNWGWGGNFNCYCRLTGTNALNSGGTGTGGSEDDYIYDQNQTAVINIIPQEGGLESPYLREYESGAIALKDGASQINNYNYTHSANTDKYLILSENIWNLSRTLTQFQIGVKATDTTTGYVYYFSNTATANMVLTQILTYNRSFNINEIPYNGTYKLNMVARNANSTSDDDWYDVEVASNVDCPIVNISGAQEQSKIDVEMWIENSSVQVNRTVGISHSSAYTGKFTYSSSDESIATVDANGVVKGIAEGNVTITAKATGNQYFNATTKTFDVEVIEFEKEDVDAQILATGLIIGGSTNITITSGYDGTVTYTSSDKNVVTVSSDGTVNAIGIGTATITVNIPTTTLYTGKTVTFDMVVSEPGIILAKAPYFSNNNNPWEDEMTLHIPFYNGTASTTSVDAYLKFTFGYYGGGILYPGSVTLPSGSYYDLTTSVANIQSRLIPNADQPLTIEFYHDQACTEPFNYPSITYTYRNTLDTKVKSGYSTLILPFDADVPNGLKVYSCKRRSGNVLKLVEEKQIKQNVPYIVYNSTSGDISFRGPNIVDATDKFIAGYLTGMVKETEVPANAYTFETRNGISAFYKYETTTTGVANTCYIASGTVDAYYLSSADAASDIETISALTSNQIESIYTTNGTKITHLQKGMNILKMQDGSVRKVLVK